MMNLKIKIDGSIKQFIDDKMLYVIAGVIGIICIVILVCGIYSYVQRKDKGDLLINIMFSI